MSSTASRTCATAARRLGRVALGAAMLGALVTTTTGAGAVSSVAGDGPWQRVAGGFSSAQGDLQTDPDQYAAYTLDTSALQSRLATAPSERAARGSSSTVSLPAPDGGFTTFAISETSVMQSGLAAAHPEITTYAGRGVDDPTLSIRMDYTSLGFHASVRGPAGRGAWYIDPVFSGDTSRYASYYGSDLANPHGAFRETADSRGLPAAEKALGSSAPPRRDNGAPVRLRTYRLALVTDPSYAAYFGKDNVTDAKVTLMNRVDQIYEDDLAIHMELINATDKLNLNTKARATGTNGPCGAEGCFTPKELKFCSVDTLLQNRIAIGQLVGASKYDIGHIGLGVNGGGISGLGVVGGRGKAIGCTGLPQPVGDIYAVDYVAHEMGHEYGGNHTFNGAQFNCAGANRNASTSVEPGSGSSVMGYAGICGQDDLQRHSDPYFSERSITELTKYARSQQPAINEVQNVSLRHFGDKGDAFTISYNGNTSAKIVKGKNYTMKHLEQVLADLTGGKVTVERFGGAKGPLGNTGFQVSFQGSNRKDNVDLLKIHGQSGNVKALVGETVKGGPVDNRGDKVENTGNTAPTVHAGRNHTIPARTPFQLTGGGDDADGDALTYLWEQNDRGGKNGTALVDNTKRNGSLFRQFGRASTESTKDSLRYQSDGENLADGNPSRTFPDMAQILNGNTNAETGKCPKATPLDENDPSTFDVPRKKTACFSEFLPTADYVGRPGTNASPPSLHFRLTARDTNPGAGGTGYDDTKLTIDRTAGPLLVTSQTLDGKKQLGGQIGKVRWEVHHTDRSDLAPRVRISVSTNGGRTWGHEARAHTKNDGSARVTWPNVNTNHARVKVEAVGNVFFDVNDGEFTIQ